MMSFEITKVSDVGVANPIVARLSMQTAELVRWLGAPDAQRQQIKTLYFYKLQPRLLQCEKYKNDLLEKIIAADKQVEANKAIPGRLKLLPHIIGLQGLVEHFLYESKNYLRDLLELFQFSMIVHSQTPAHLLTSASKVIANLWSGQKKRSSLKAV